MVNTLLKVDFKTILIFLLIEKNGSISKTAIELNMTPSAISKRLYELEQLAQFKLFERMPGKMVLTLEGKEIFRHIKSIHLDVESLFYRISQIKYNLNQYIRVISNPSSIIQFLSDDIALFIKNYPKVKIEIKEKVSDDVIDDLINNKADIGIYSGNSDTKGLEKHIYNHDQLILLVPVEHSLAQYGKVCFSSALDYNFVTFDINSSIFKLINDEAKKLAKHFNISTRLNDFSAIYQMVKSGIGIGILPFSTADNHNLNKDRLKIITLTDKWAQRTLYISFSPSGHLSPSAMNLFNYLKKS